MMRVVVVSLALLAVSPLALATYYDKEAGMLYNMHRNLDPSVGRYIESDPIGLRGGTNTYAYVNSDPLRFIDPLGLLKWTGNINTVGAFGGLGGQLLYFILRSECMCGKIVQV